MKLFFLFCSQLDHFSFGCGKYSALIIFFLEYLKFKNHWLKAIFMRKRWVIVVLKTLTASWILCISLIRWTSSICRRLSVRTCFPSSLRISSSFCFSSRCWIARRFSSSPSAMSSSCSFLAASRWVLICICWKEAVSDACFLRLRASSWSLRMDSS